MKEMGLSWNDLMQMNWALLLRIMSDLPRQVKKDEIEEVFEPQTTDQVKAFMSRANRNAQKPK